MAELAAFSESELRQEVHLSLGHAKLLFLSLAPHRALAPAALAPSPALDVPTPDASPAPGRRSSKKRRARKAKA